MSQDKERNFQKANWIKAWEKKNNWSIQRKIFSISKSTISLFFFVRLLPSLVQKIEPAARRDDQKSFKLGFLKHDWIHGLWFSRDSILQEPMAIQAQVSFRSDGYSRIRILVLRKSKLGWFPQGLILSLLSTGLILSLRSPTAATVEQKTRVWPIQARWIIQSNHDRSGPRMYLKQDPKRKLEKMLHRSRHRYLRICRKNGAEIIKSGQEKWRKQPESRPAQLQQENEREKKRYRRSS